MRYNILVLMIITSCSGYNSKESALEREQRLVNNYHKKIVIEKGKETFYIPKAEVNWYYKDKKEIAKSELKKGDNVSFFDLDGNIIYQSLIDSISTSEIYIRCLDLSNAEYYITTLDTKNIKDLDSTKYIIKFYR